MQALFSKKRCFFPPFYCHTKGRQRRGQQPEISFRGGHQKKKSCPKEQPAAPSKDSGQFLSPVRPKKADQTKLRRSSAIQRRDGQEVKQAQGKIGPHQNQPPLPSCQKRGKQKICRRPCQSRRQFFWVRQSGCIRFHYHPQHLQTKAADPGAKKPQHQKMPQFVHHGRQRNHRLRARCDGTL